MACKIAMQKRHAKLVRLVGSRTEAISSIIKESNATVNKADFNIKLSWPDISLLIEVDRCEVFISCVSLNESNTEKCMEFTRRLLAVSSTALKIERTLNQCQLNERTNKE